ncbi:Tripartite ATP-independent transporter, DctQ component [Octadecabacter temperatus]|uniref:TRAP transporter small permease protein n=1 Tax=Octadecabacter temperatus TaxID=1458307 RepID=A0A0K0Y4L1_9RHOB|nr:TRAP transporter small permease [Octadecabacter temperatus]AKS45787.1 Tripartite ATP-independent periplasmic transporter, DctQ component [Octadecabacter temperatus]SIO00511.1 Tripartite ATP-independent transporter, DctQ component [Octadecabacter temperatus]
MGGRLAIGLVAAAYVVILFIGAFEDRREALADAIGMGDMAFVGLMLAILWIACLIRPVPAVQAHAAINERLHKACKAISIGALILMVCFILLQVFMRYALNDAPNWTEEAARFGMLWMTGLMAPVAYRHGGFVAIDMLERALAPRLSAVLTLILFGMSLAVLLVMWDKGLNNHVDTLSGRGCSSTLRWPFGIEIGKCRAKFSNYYQYIALWIGINLLILACVELILRQILKLFGKDTGLAPLGDEDMASAS